jgi:hypothetical protein
VTRTFEHFRRFLDNTALADEFAAAGGKAAPWEIVLRFYAVVHLVEGYLRTKDPRFWSDHHEVRVRQLRASPEVKVAAAIYKDLQNLSEQVRYDPVFEPTTADFERARVWAAKVESIIKSKTERKIGDPGER